MAHLLDTLSNTYMMFTSGPSLNPFVLLTVIIGLYLPLRVLLLYSVIVSFASTKKETRGLVVGSGL